MIFSGWKKLFMKKKRRRKRRWVKSKDKLIWKRSSPHSCLYQLVIDLNLNIVWFIAHSEVYYFSIFSVILSKCSNITISLNMDTYLNSRGCSFVYHTHFQFVYNVRCRTLINTELRIMTMPYWSINACTMYMH